MRYARIKFTRPEHSHVEVPALQVYGVADGWLRLSNAAGETVAEYPSSSIYAIEYFSKESTRVVDA